MRGGVSVCGSFAIPCKNYTILHALHYTALLYTYSLTHSLTHLLSAVRKQKVCLIDPKRAQNAAITLTRMKNLNKSYEEVKQLIEALDDTQFTTDQLTAMDEFLPTTDEVDVLLLSYVCFLV